jgi:transposase-like protein
METFAKPGDFCPNETCREYRKLQNKASKRNIIKAGKTNKGVQRYECKTCGITFTETFGTPFYGKRTPASEILETLALLAEGNRISSLTRVKGHKEDTIWKWLRDAAKHTEAVEEVLMKRHRIKRGQLDGLWLYVGNKGEKKLPGNAAERAIYPLNHTGYG